MSQNLIQFQHGLSWPQFQALCGTEAQCEAAVVAARWPHGWRCAHCGCTRFFHTRNGPGRLLWECLVCGYQSSSIVGTVMEHNYLDTRRRRTGRSFPREVKRSRSKFPTKKMPVSA